MSAGTQVVMPVSPVVDAFLQTAGSRKQAVHVVRSLYRMPDGAEIPETLAVAAVEAYYAGHGGKPWLRKKKCAP
ncbi:MAG: hypothetical protein LC798_10725 [Chloroflexi bacterium]|nr:hypothetical protein [Chloroflexota bacterium]